MVSTKSNSLCVVWQLNREKSWIREVTPDFQSYNSNHFQVFCYLLLAGKRQADGVVVTYLSIEVVWAQAFGGDSEAVICNDLKVNTTDKLLERQTEHEYAELK